MDFTHTEQWDPGTVSTTRTDDGPLREGTTFHNVSEFRGRRTELDYRIEVLERDARLVFAGRNRTVEATDDMTFTARGEATLITYRATFHFKGIARLAEPFLRGGFDSLADETVAQLTATLEQQL